MENKLPSPETAMNILRQKSFAELKGKEIVEVAADIILRSVEGVRAVLENGEQPKQSTDLFAYQQRPDNEAEEEFSARTKATANDVLSTEEIVSSGLVRGETLIEDEAYESYGDGIDHVTITTLVDSKAMFNLAVVQHLIGKKDSAVHEWRALLWVPEAYAIQAFNKRRKKL